MADNQVRTQPGEELLPPWATPPTTGTPVEPGFRWPWQTPTGEGFLGGDVPQISYIDPTTGKPVIGRAPTEPAETGPNFGPYSDPGQIPPELLELYDWEPFEEQYIDESGKTARISMYRLIPKATEGMSEYQRQQMALKEAEFIAKYGGAEGAPAGMTEEERRYLELREQEAQRAHEQTLWERGQVEGGARGPQWRPGELELQQQQLAAEQAWRQQQLGSEQQQYAAQLASQPKSWLEYAAYTGQPPVVQPWMLPLMPQQYPELAGLQAGQPIPGWPEQFGAPTGGGATIGTQPTAGYGATTPTTGYGGTTPGGTQPTVSAGWRPQTVDEYLARGLSPSEAEEAAEYDRLHAVWRGATPGPEKAEAFLTKGQYAAERPETIDRYQQAISNVQSGEPMYGQLSSKEKMQLQTLMGQYGGERPPGYAFAKYNPIGSYIDTSIPEVSRWLGAATTGESRTASYPEPTTTPYAPTQMPIEERTPKRKPTPSYTPTQIPMEESMGNVMAYIPGRSWHNIDPQGIGSEVGKSNWLGRMRQMGTRPGEGREPTQAPTTQPLGSTGQAYNPAQYAAGSWAGYNPNLPLGQMPAVTRPSRQYQARMGPTALDQYYAYTQARTGITPQEMQFRLGSMAPPGGGYSGLRWMR